MQFSTQREISETTNTKIEELKIQIQTEEANLAREKEKGELLASWYMDGEAGMMEAVIGSDFSFGNVDRTRYYEAVRVQIDSMN